MASSSPADAHDALVSRAVDRPGVVVLLGGIDSGKTTVARQLLRAAVEADVPSAFIDTDLGQSTVGPPTTIGLRRVRTSEDLDDPFDAHECYFVGDVSPRGHLLPLITGTARLLEAARREAHLVVMDTSGFVAGIIGQTLKFHKLELARPDYVVGLQRGGELEPLLRIAHRFTAADVVRLPVHPAVRATTVEQRADNRRDRLARYFSGELRRYRVKPGVFMPSLPPGFDTSLLHGLLVGTEDGRGRCVGVGALVHEDGALRLVTTAVEAPRALRLGSTRVDDRWAPRSVNLGDLFGSA